MAKPSLIASDTTVLAAAGVALAMAAIAVPALQPKAATAALTPICRAPHGASTVRSGYGSVSFANTCSAAVQPALQLAVAKLHSFEAEASDFTNVAKRDPGCAIAWWGAAMSARGNPLGGALDAQSLATGRRDVDKALAVKTASPREKALIGAMDTYYRAYPDTIARGRAYSDKMDAVHTAYPDDPDIAALDGLAIVEGVDLNDKTFARQKRAGAILEAVMQAHPENPGAPHYLIHAYDYTALAPLAVHAAEVESKISPASSHAQHMPSHIWSMLGRWDASIDANRRSEFIAEPDSAHDPVKGDIVFGHAFDFIAYARLQKGEDRHVAQDLVALRGKGGQELGGSEGGMPTIVVARYALERGDWADAARVPVPGNDPFDAVLARFARAYGAARAGDVAQAKTEVTALKALRGPVAREAGEYWGQFVDIYADAAAAWILKDEGHADAALAMARKAADADDGHEKHIYLENKILPMREALGDMEAELAHPREALAAYEGSLTLAPDRYRSYLGAAQAAEAFGDRAAAKAWSEKLLALAKDGDKARPGWGIAEAIHAKSG